MRKKQFAPTKHREPRSSSRGLGSISCRIVGPGGTTVTFYPSPDGIRCVWVNENCPYDLGGTVDDIGASSDGHNVDVISWETVRKMAASEPIVKKKNNATSY